MQERGCTPNVRGGGARYPATDTKPKRGWVREEKGAVVSSTTLPITMTPTQVAERWGIDARTVRDMLAAGTLHGFKVGTGGIKSQWRVLQSEVERFEREGVAVNA